MCSLIISQFVIKGQIGLCIVTRCTIGKGRPAEVARRRERRGRGEKRKGEAERRRKVIEGEKREAEENKENI